VKVLTLLSLILLFNGTQVAAAEDVARVLVVKGNAFIKGIETPIELGTAIKSGDTLITKAATLLKVRFIDNTLISLGPNSIFEVKNFKINDGKRTSVFHFLRGKIRAHVKEKRKEGESIIYSNAEIALGVRGTEILANSYLVKGAPSTDVLLTKGAVKMNLSKLGTSVASFDLTPGKAFNSNLVRQEGISSIKSISKASLDLLEKGDEFLPSLQAKDGSFLDLEESFKRAKVNKALPKTLEKASIAMATPKVLAPTASSIAGGFKYILKNEPWDIRDAVINREKNKANNKCYYYFYKSIPGSGELERFRRERDCNEYENDLD
jgi:hypothetical protein